MTKRSRVTLDETVLDQKREPEQNAARVIGFARPNCKRCLGRGRLGWDTKYGDHAHVIPCPCIEFFDLEVVQQAWQKSQQESLAVDAANAAAGGLPSTNGGDDEEHHEQGFPGNEDMK